MGATSYRSWTSFHKLVPADHCGGWLEGGRSWIHRVTFHAMLHAHLRNAQNPGQPGEGNGAGEAGLGGTKAGVTVTAHQAVVIAHVATNLAASMVSNSGAVRVRLGGSGGGSCRDSPSAFLPFKTAALPLHCCTHIVQVGQVLGQHGSAGQPEDGPHAVNYQGNQAQGEALPQELQPGRAGGKWVRRRQATP